MYKIRYDEASQTGYLSGDIKISDIYFKEGDIVSKGAMIMEIELEKSTLDLESPSDGVLSLFINKGDTCESDKVLAMVTNFELLNEGGFQGLFWNDNSDKVIAGDLKRFDYDTSSFVIDSDTENEIKFKRFKLIK